MIAKLKALSAWKKFEEIVRSAIISFNPSFGKFDRVIYGRINRINIRAGKVDDTKKRFSVDVQPLRKGLDDDPNLSPILDVPFDSMLFGNNGGVFSAPARGAIVRIGFMYDDPSLPFIHAVTNEGRTIPAAESAAIRIESDSGAVFQIKDGKISFKVGSFNTDLETFLDEFLAHNHLGNLGSPTGPPASGVPPITAASFKTGEL